MNVAALRSSIVIVFIEVSRMEGGKKNASRQLTAQLAALRERVRELESLQSGRQAIETELSGARQRYQHLLAVSPAIIYTTYASGDFACTFVSENIRTIMGFAPEEMTTDPKGWPDRLHPDDAPRVFNELAPLIEQGGGTVEYRFQHRDGHYVWVQDTFRVLYDDAGHPLELVGAWADITKLKEAERNVLTVNAELQETKQSLSRLLAASPAIIYTTRASGDFACTFVSENIQTIMGFSPEGMTTDPKGWPDRLHPDDAPRVFNELGPLIEDGGGTVEYRFRHRDGHYVWVQDTFRVLRNVEPLMGFSEWEMLEDPEFWVKRLHPDDAPRVFEKMAPLVEQGGGTIEYRFRHRDGHYVWIQDTFRVVRDDTGVASEIVGSWADITHRKQVEHALGERMALMDDLQNLVAASPAVIYTTKATGDFACTFVSENLLSTMGYAPWEMREDPKFWSKRLHPEDAPRVYKELASMIERGEGATEYRFRHRRAHYLWIQDTFKVIRDSEGKPKELVGSWADISDRKQIEAELGGRGRGTTKPVHPRDLRPLPDRRGGRQFARVAWKSAHRRGEAQSHYDDGRSPGLHVAIRTVGAEMGRRNSQSIFVDHGQGHQTVRRHY